MDLDIVLVVFFILAVVIFLQLRSALGKRTGNERPPFDPMKRTQANSSARRDDNVVPLPNRQTQRADDFSDIDAVAPQSSRLNEGLRAIRTADSSFTPQSFSDGSRMAYEMVMTAFANGDTNTLKNLLARDVFDGFNAAISERDAKGETVKFSFVGIDKADIVAADVNNGVAEITVRIASEVISATYDKDEKLVEGDPQEVTQLHDLWTFARDTRSRDPNWQVIATDEDA
ncbi:Tim44/TimA family putative adaptor protein [Bartonella sp. HY329]|uniref:Tim44/TimA family putative adaptor protein n=1 Tax=unclassified Bartonella TaxID=2645622 RepID=UPI0021C5D8E6|nr:MULTISPECIES: Tim44/TimA family putative adaptor protein [unclassified Bartonella]UXM95817.1 Tim44/TimA family putative adaptor protein [Bartonella sp. HY329]UXN10142.1 Tim44/TimA family putative adaptor protein [Bartonella sp. HY328]